MKFITIRPGGGRFGNRVIFYMAALAIADKIGGATICGVGFEAWNIPEIPPPEGIDETIILKGPRSFHPEILAAATADKPSFNIVLDYHMQNVRQFLDVAYYRKFFPVLHNDVPIFDERYMLIHIRGGDILDGSVAWYPLTPVEFLREIVEITGTLPVFMGELKDGFYIRQLRAAFPGALFLEQQTLMRDFDMIRQAKNILLTASTFSWTAAWLSDATNIHIPLNGFFNPAHMRHIDLLPEADERYHFYLFPLNYAVPEKEALRVHEKIRGKWKKISAAKVRQLKDAPPQLSVTETSPVDLYWYLKAYPDAAMDISEGWYENAEAHYTDIGWKAGYLPFAPLVIAPPPAFANVALGKPAAQSSIWDGQPAKSCEADAAGAVDGNFFKDIGFHTAHERDPWWMVNLTLRHRIYEIHIYNRTGYYAVRARATPLVLLCSEDGVIWRELLRTDPGELFGAEQGPLIWRSDEPASMRYVKILLEHSGQYLHLAQVAVFGEAAPPLADIAREWVGDDRQVLRSAMPLPRTAVVLAHQRKCRRAVVVRIGAGSVFFNWFKPAAPRSWDVLLSFYKLPDQPFTADIETIIVGGLSKYSALKDVMTARPDIYDGYEHLLLLDDDIGFVFEDVDRLFDLAAAYDLDLAQASLSHDSAAYWPFLKQHDGTLLRYTNLVEVMMPLFSRAAFLRCVETFDQSISSWGLDFVWAALLAERSQSLAVIDTVVATHLRPVDLGEGAFYKYLQSINVNPAAEQTAVQRKYGVTRRVKEYGVVGEIARST